MLGLARVGSEAADRAAANLTAGLVRAARAFDFRIPELYGGQAHAERPAPPPYPAACRPQAWSAASAVAVLTAALGLRPDVPAGLVRLRPLQPWPLGRVRVHSLRVAGHRLDVEVAENGRLSLPERIGDLRVLAQSLARRSLR